MVRFLASYTEIHAQVKVTASDSGCPCGFQVWAVGHRNSCSMKVRGNPAKVPVERDVGICPLSVPVTGQWPPATSGIALPTGWYTPTAGLGPRAGESSGLRCSPGTCIFSWGCSLVVAWDVQSPI